MKSGKKLVISIILLIFITFLAVTWGKGHKMKLVLKTMMPETTIVSGSGLMVRLILKNTGSETIQVPSLDENNEITNYQLETDDGRIIGIYNHITRQQLLEFRRIRRGEFKLITLAPGQEEVRDYDFMLLHWLDTPGKYRIRGFYRWKDIELLSDPASFQIVPANVTSYDQRWCYHYGEKFYLHSVMVVLHNGKYQLWLKEAARFSPKIIEFDNEVYAQKHSLSPVVSFNQSLMEDSQVWISWLSGSRLECLKTDYGVSQCPPIVFETKMENGARVISPTLMPEDKGLLVMIQGRHKEKGPGILVIRLDQSGREVKRSFLGIDTGGEEVLSVPSEHGDCHLFWKARREHGLYEIMHLVFDTNAICPKEKADCLWKGSEDVTLVFSSPLLREKDMSVYCVLQGQQNPYELKLIRLFLEGHHSPVLMNTFQVPLKDRLTEIKGEIDSDNRAHLLFLTESHDLYYLNFTNEIFTMVASKIGTDAPALLHLVVNHRNQVFAGYNWPSKGLEWTLMPEDPE